MASKKDKYLESAQRFMLKGQLDKAIKDYQQVVALEPKEIRYRQKLAELLVRDSRKQEAIAQYEDIGKHYAENSYFLKAIAVYKQIQRLDPDNTTVLLTLASLNHKQGLIGNALAEYGQVLARYEKEGSFKEAVKVLEQMLAIDGEQVATRLKYAELLFATGANDASFQAFEALLSSLQRKKDPAAEAVSQRIVELFPDRQQEDVSSIAARVAAGDYDGAISALQELLRTDSRDLAAWQLLCDAETRRGNGDGVRRAYQQMMKLFPDDLAVVEGAIRSDIEAGERSGGLRLLELQLPRFLQKGASSRAEALFLMFRQDAGSDTRVADGLRRIYQATGEREKLEALSSTNAALGVTSPAEQDPFGAQPASLESDPFQLPQSANELPNPFETDAASSAAGAPYLADSAAAGGAFPWEEEIELDLDDEAAPSAGDPSSIDLPLDFSLPLDFNDALAGDAPAPVAEEASPFGDFTGSEASPFSVTASPLAESVSPSEEPASFGDAPSYGDLSFLSDSAPSGETGDAPLELTLPDDLAFPDIEWSDEVEHEATSVDAAQPSATPSAPLELSQPSQPWESAAPFETSELSELSGMSELPDLPDLADLTGFSAAPPEPVAAANKRGWDEIFPGVDVDAAAVDLEELESHYDLGVGYKEMGMYQKAIGEFSVAAGNPQRRLDCLTLQAICYRDKGEADKAQDLLQRGRELDVISEEERMGLTYELAFLLEGAGSAEQAIELYREVHSIDPGFHDVAERLSALTGEEQLDFIDLEMEDGEL